MDVGRPGRISVEDIVFLIRKDTKKYSRVKELLMMNEELRKARKAFDEVKYVSKWCVVLLCYSVINVVEQNSLMSVNTKRFWAKIKINLTMQENRVLI